MSLRGETTLAKQFDVYPSQMTHLKLQAVEKMAATSDKEAAGEIAQADRKELYTKIGQLTPYFGEDRAVDGCLRLLVPNSIQ